MNQTPSLQPISSSFAPIKVTHHLGILDFLRGLAALTVVLYHFSGYGPWSFLAKFRSTTMSNTFSWGYLGVEIFFVISGFIIPYSLWGSEYKISQFLKYMAKRLGRICPPAYVTILLIIAQWFIIDNFIHHNNDRITEVTLGRVISNFLFIVPYTKYQWFNGVFWTLLVEIQFYIFIGIFYNKIFNSPNLYLFVGVNIFLSIMCYFIPFLKGNNLISYSPLFTMGGVIVLFYKKIISSRSCLITLAFCFFIAWINLSLPAAVFGLATALIIAFVKLNHPVFSLFGKISYSIYLTHMLVGSTAEVFLFKLINPQNEFQHSVGIILCAIFACIGAYFYFMLIEQPFMRLVKRMTS